MRAHVHAPQSDDQNIPLNRAASHWAAEASAPELCTTGCTAPGPAALPTPAYPRSTAPVQAAVARAVLQDRENVFFTGSAGTGAQQWQGGPRRSAGAPPAAAASAKARARRTPPPHRGAGGPAWRAPPDRCRALPPGLCRQVLPDVTHHQGPAPGVWWLLPAAGRSDGVNRHRRHTHRRCEGFEGRGRGRKPKCPSPKGPGGVHLAWEEATRTAAVIRLAPASAGRI